MMSQNFKILIFFLITFIVIAGCTTVNVRKVDSSKHQINLICIEENQKVLVIDFLQVIENGFMQHGIKTEIFTGNAPPYCEYILTYRAGRSWDFVPYMNQAELRLKYDNKTIATATYKHSGGFAFNKWASTETKMAPIIDELLSDFK